MNDDDVARAISHDLRGPARRLAALLQLTKEKAGPMTAPASEYLDMALDEVATLQAQLEALQEYIRVERHVRPAQSVDLGALLTSKKDRLEGRLNAEGLPHVAFDPIHADHIVRVLVENAATHAGEAPTMTIRADDDGEHILLHFLDDGEGVGVDADERVFRLFNPVRGPDGRTRLTSGLAIARRMARHHGGDLRLGDASGGHFIWQIPKERTHE